MILMGSQSSGKVEYPKKWNEQVEFISVDELTEMYINQGNTEKQAETEVINNFERFVLEAREKKDLVILDGNFVDWVFRTTVLKSFEDKFNHIIMLVFNRSLQQLIEEEKRTSGVQELTSEVYNRIYNEYCACKAEIEEFVLLIAGVDKVYFESFNNLFF